MWGHGQAECIGELSLRYANGYVISGTPISQRLSGDGRSLRCGGKLFVPNHVRRRTPLETFQALVVILEAPEPRRPG